MMLVISRWQYGPLFLAIKEHPRYGHRCGYVSMPLDWVPPEAIPEGEFWPTWVGLDVHGGVTYAQIDGTGALYTLGFDTAHVGGEDTKYLQIEAWLRWETERLAKQVWGWWVASGGLYWREQS